jgi:hypothetical protein
VSFRIEEVVHPTDKIFIGDSWDAGSASYIAFGRDAEWLWEFEYGIHGRHTSGKALFAFMDGHGGSYSEEEKEFGLRDLGSWRIPVGYNFIGVFFRDTESE